MKIKKLEFKRDVTRHYAVAAGFDYSIEKGRVFVDFNNHGWESIGKCATEEVGMKLAQKHFEECIKEFYLED